MEELYSFFCGIKPADVDDNSFNVEDFDKELPHKLGCSKKQGPIFFVETADDTATTNINLKKVSVIFNQVCNLKTDEGVMAGRKYTIIGLQSQDADLQRYFLDLVYILLKKLPAKPTVKVLKNEIIKLVSLFTTPPVFSKEVLKGLWAELFVIARSSNPLYLINSWHVSPEDKYDFNDGLDKVEVKSTKNSERIHTFSIEQLNPNKDSKLIIASVIVIASGQGINVFDLIDEISKRVTDIDALLKLKEIAYQTIGPHLEASKKIRFDFNMAANTLKYFNHFDVPSISPSFLPVEVSNVHFSSCLKDVSAADINSTDSQLHKSL